MAQTPGPEAGGLVGRTSADWPRRLWALALAVLGLLALSGLAAGVLSQVVIGGDYDQEVQAKLSRPLIVPCFVAVVAGLAGAVAWWAAFLRGSARRWLPAPFVAVLAVSLGVAFAVAGPSERDLQDRWTKRLSGLRLSDTFTPRPPDPLLVTEDYRVVRQWMTAQDPEAACPALQQVLSAWFGFDVKRQGTTPCFLSAVHGTDLVTASFAPFGTPPVTTLTVDLQYAL
jgi:hypothetical protein